MLDTCMEYACKEEDIIYDSHDDNDYDDDGYFVIKSRRQSYNLDTPKRSK